MQSQIKDKDDIKVFILYLMNEIDYPLEYGDIHDIAVGDGFVNSFDFADCFKELLDAGNVCEKLNGETQYYEITPHGEHVAEYLSSGILRQVRERALRSAIRYISFKTRGATLSCDIKEREDGKYDYHCEIGERGETILSLSMTVDTKKQAERMKYNFDGNAEEIYRKIRAAFAEGV